MQKYIVGIYNWSDKTVNFVTEYAETGLLAMEQANILPEVGKMTEEEYCQYEIKRGGFIGYLLESDFLA